MKAGRIAGLDPLTDDDFVTKRYADALLGKGLIKVVSIGPLMGTSQIPFDGTTPLVTEGSAIATVSITAKFPTSVLDVWGALQLDSGSSNRNITIALFKGSVCIGAQACNIPSSGRPVNMAFSFSDSNIGGYPDTEVTYTLRVGVNTSATWYVNRGASLYFNGQNKSAVFFRERLG